MADAHEYWNKHWTFEGYTGAEKVELNKPDLIMEEQCDILVIAS